MKESTFAAFSATGTASRPTPSWPLPMARVVYIQHEIALSNYGKYIVIRHIVEDIENLFALRAFKRNPTRLEKSASRPGR